jgi:hypothetical protein
MNATMQLEREYWQYQAEFGVGTPLYESHEWKTMSGSHYSYIGREQKVYQYHPGSVELVMSNVQQMWFPGAKGYRPFFVCLDHTGSKLFFRSNLVTEFTSSDWARERSQGSDLQTWYVLREGKTGLDKWASKQVVIAR